MANCGSRAAWASPSLSTPPARRLSRRLIKRNSTVQGSTSRCLECLWTTHQGCSLLAGAARKPAPTVRVLNIAQLYTDPFPCFCWAIGTREIPGQPHGFSFLLKHRCRHFGGEWLIGLAFYFLHLWQGVAGMLYRGSCRWRRCDAACNDYGSRAKRQVWPRPEAACRIPAEQQLGKENSCCKEERNAEKEKCFSKKDRREKRWGNGTNHLQTLQTRDAKVLPVIAVDPLHQERQAVVSGDTRYRVLQGRSSWNGSRLQSFL